MRTVTLDRLLYKAPGRGAILAGKSSAVKPHTRYTPHEALALVLDAVDPLPSETVALEHAHGRVLSEPLAACLDDPRFDKAAVDGYGLRTDEPEANVAGKEFTVVADLAAGDGATVALAPGEAVRIMTGARVPAGVGQVIKVENCELAGSTAKLIVPERITNIAFQGENIRAGDPLLSPRRLRAQDIGVLASQGYAEVPVTRRPRVAVISTGNEVVAPGEPLPEAGIHDSNGYQLSGLAREAGAEVTRPGIVQDDPRALHEEIARAAASHDVVILSGGVSMGELDYVPRVVSDLGASIIFHGLAVKPGRPTLYAVLDGAPPVARTRIFGLPGNPVSTIVQFELLIRPLLDALLGETPASRAPGEARPGEARLPLAEAYTRRNADRYEYLPGVVRDGEVVRLRYEGSGHISVLADAEIFFRIDAGVDRLDAGSEVDVRFIR